MFIERDPSKLGIYIHFPFCMQKCDYCDFYSLSIEQKSQNEILEIFTNRVKEEFKFYYKFFKNFSCINTIYFGGGTSSFLKKKHINEILKIIKDYFQIEKNCEITLEGNPEHLYNSEYLLDLKEIGINRISLGFQTKNFEFLKFINRYYIQEHYEKVLSSVSSNYENWNVDLIYGYPNQTFKDFIEDLEYCLSFSPKHISCYSLTLEKNTMYYQKVKNKILKQPNYALQEKIFEFIPEYLKKFNIYPYEVSNYSLRNYECRHNLRYWLYEPYWGLGPSAHSFNGMYRFQNPRNWEKWLKTFPNQPILHDPLKEIPLTMFRLRFPILIHWIKSIAENHLDLFINFFIKQEKKGLGKYYQSNEKSYFLWNEKGISILDSLILEFYEEIDNFLIKMQNK